MLVLNVQRDTIKTSDRLAILVEKTERKNTFRRVYNDVIPVSVKDLQTWYGKYKEPEQVFLEL